MSATNCPETPRQKMISMMYLVLTAMLALNVSTDVLNGFTLVQKSLSQSLASTTVKNQSLYGQFEDLKSQNPEKVAEWLNKANIVRQKTDSMNEVLEQLKYDIIVKADGQEGGDLYKECIKNGTQYAIGARDNLDASAQVAMAVSMQGASANRANQLKVGLNKYAALMEQMVQKDSTRIKTIRDNFNTEDTKTQNGDPITWEASRFEMIPVSASITLLTKIQTDLRYTESEVVNYLKNQVDASDFRVNKITAEVIPTSSYVTRGGVYEARIILAAIDSTKRPKITVNGKVLENEKYTVGCSSVGTFDIKGQIDLPRADGSIQSYPFESSYIVGEPTAIISADMMNVFYAGIENPMSVSVPGVPTQNVSVSITNGILTRKGSGWTVRPTKVGQDCKISVSAKMEGGKVQSIGSKPFRVKALPPPIGYIEYRENGNPAKYKGGKAFAKANLISSNGVKAELDDADLDVRYNVLGFDITFFDSMGNGRIETSNNTAFTEKQLDLMRKMSRGKTFYISRIRAKGPDGIERILPPIEVKVK